MFTVHECGVVMRSVASVCTSGCAVRVLTFESPDLEPSFLICLSIRLSGSSSYIKFIKSRSKLQEQIVDVSVCCLSDSNLWMPWHTNFIFLVADTASEHLGQGRLSRSWGQGQGHTSVINTYIHESSAFNNLVYSRGYRIISAQLRYHFDRSNFGVNFVADRRITSKTLQRWSTHFAFVMWRSSPSFTVSAQRSTTLL